MNKAQLPYGLKWYEVGYLFLVAVALYYSGSEFRAGWTVPIIGLLPWVFFGLVVAVGIAVVAGRSPEEFRKLPNKTFFFILLAAWVALFAFLGNATLGYESSPSLFAWMFDVYTAPESDAQYGVLIPFVVLALFLWKRQELVARPLGLWWPGILLVTFALLLHLAGHAIQQTQFSALAFFLGIYGLTGLAWGRNWLKASLFPYFLLAFCIPLGNLLDGFTFRLRLLVSSIVAGIAHLGLAPDLIRDGTQLFDAQHTFAFEVVAACSGIHSLFALLALTIVWGFVVFKTRWKRAVLIASAVPLAVLGNVIRLCFTIMVSELGGQTAGKAVENKAGFVTFTIAIVSIYFISTWLEKSEPKPELPASETPKPSSDLPGKAVPL